jgi:hypothetical protein
MVLRSTWYDDDDDNDDNNNDNDGDDVEEIGVNADRFIGYRVGG